MDITQAWIKERTDHLDTLEEQAKLDHVLNMGKLLGAREQLAVAKGYLEAEEKKTEEAETTEKKPKK